MVNGKTINTITDYMNDETRVSPAERERINFEVSLIARENPREGFDYTQRRELYENTAQWRNSFIIKAK